MESTKRKNEEKKYSNFVYISALRYALVLIIFVGGSFAFFAFMLNGSLADEKAPSPKEIAIETADLLATYPEFADWERKDDLRIALWLPKTFEQFKTDDVLDMPNRNMKDIPFPLNLNIELFARMPGTLHFLAFDESTYSAEYFRHILIFSDIGQRNMLDDYIGIFTDGGSDITVLQQPEEFRTDRYSGKSIITETDMGFGSFATIFYFVSKNGLFYTIWMQTSVNQLDESKQIMEKAINTLWIYSE